MMVNVARKVARNIKKGFNDDIKVMELDYGAYAYAGEINKYDGKPKYYSYGNTKKQAVRNLKNKYRRK